MPEVTQFLNVDLDIVSRSDLQPLLDAWGKRVMVLYAGRERRRYDAHLELRGTPRDAARAIRGFCRLIDALPPALRDLWEGASVRDFNVGVQAGHSPHSVEFALPATVLKAAHEAGARIVFTVYAPAAAGSAE